MNDSPLPPDVVDALTRLQTTEAHTAARYRKYLLFPLLLGVAVTALAMWEGRALAESRATLTAVRDSVRSAKDSLHSYLDDAELERQGLYRKFIRDYPGALRYYDAALRHRPDDPLLLADKGYVVMLLARQRRDSTAMRNAVAILQHAVLLDSTYVTSHYNLAQAYWTVGDTTAAVGEVADVLRLAPQARGIILGDPGFDRFHHSAAYRGLIAKSKPQQR